MSGYKFHTTGILTTKCIRLKYNSDMIADVIKNTIEMQLGCHSLWTTLVDCLL